MMQLKARLEEKLGAIKAPDAQGTHELRIASRAPAKAPAAGRKTPGGRAIVDRHRDARYTDMGSLTPPPCSEGVQQGSDRLIEPTTP